MGKPNSEYCDIVDTSSINSNDSIGSLRKSFDHIRKSMDLYDEILRNNTDSYDNENNISSITLFNE